MPTTSTPERTHQSAVHDAGWDYTVGSPHLRHHRVNARVVDACRQVVARVLDRSGTCRVLEVGAGHGAFTDHVAALGAEVHVTEMSESSAALLRRRFAHNRRVTVTHDPTGAACHTGPPVDVVLAISVLHHIPDYLGATRALVERTAPGGAFVSYQDPLWYPRRSAGDRAADRAAYLLWRLGRGDLRRGAATLLRRARGEYDETNPSDMVEYHVVRSGVDEEALRSLLAARFASAHLDRYWSTQSPWLQSAGERLAPPNTFGLIATGRLPR
ncbi:class I SAM-dependent methyltransferase [Actinokineospora guangxiensis]|uniref:Class I SAM-dependent methyltransferase n=1 Tax=Actinokineospora guangxiensis TaxID=1490288 RepID=A0ABW0ELX5_9PSEU